MNSHRGEQVPVLFSTGHRCPWELVLLCFTGICFGGPFSFSTLCKILFFFLSD